MITACTCTNYTDAVHAYLFIAGDAT